MALDQRIHTWLGSISDTFEPLAPLEKKRPYDDAPSVLQKRCRTDSPTHETSSNLDSQLRQLGAKRQRTLLDYGVTPQAVLEERAASAPSFPRPHSPDPSPNARTQIDYFSLHLPPNSLPPSLQLFMNKVNEICRGDGILLNSDRKFIKDTRGTEEYKDWDWARGPQGERYFHADRELLGMTPSPNVVGRILYQAQFCHASGASQADWNIEVIQRILEASLRPVVGPASSQPIDFRSSTTATVIPEYNTDSLHPRQTEFSIYIEPACDPDSRISRQVHNFCQSLPCGTFNHLNLPTLRARPIAFSIETLQDNTVGYPGLRKGASMLPHWKFLDDLLASRDQAYQARRKWEWENDPASHANSEALARIVGFPEFLPGIVIQGHKWHLVIAIPKGGKMAFCEKISFGNTASSKGIYQIICVLQLLKHWVREFYWPWLRRLLLHWPRPPGGR
ncbi:hypothetical protein BKA59DRAFT_476007 [Fusarium tricinctum]|uniref:PD-(D/E)XK nuclease-like domain-containing protein n=1 Tax=Fusarium tricinctum TaxID=61284 RepID=A0A8K0RX90_9HYPO|nr:hypothetical protein BKA59DRAFT_476007 [Fusarium tricinctum]